MERRVSTHLTLLYLVSGRIAVTCDGKQTEMGPEDILTVNLGQTMSIRVHEHGALFRLSYEMSVLDELLPVERRQIRFGSALQAEAVTQEARENFAQLRDLLQSILYEYLKNGSRITAGIAGMSFTLLDRLAACCAGEEGMTDAPGEKYDKRIREILAYIHQNYTYQISLSELAKRFYLSDSHLSRVFKSTVGRGFREYLTEVRLESAERELRESEKSIIRIANDNGFSGLAAFNRGFKERYGETPSAYKRRLQTQETAEEVRATAGKPDASGFIRQYEARMPQTEQITAVEVDARDAALYRKPWKDAINVGVASDLLNPTVQRQLLTLRNQLDFTYVRFWNLFLDNFIYYPDALGSPLYFSKMDGVVDFLLANHLKPFIQFGPKDKSIIRSYSEIDNRSRRSSESIAALDDAGWEGMLDTIFRHLVSKYGGEEVESWIFEMWAPCPWDGIWPQWYTEEKFAALYRCVRKYVPGALVGGCEFIDNVHLEQMPAIAREWRRLGIDPDFVSFSALPYELGAEGVTAASGRQAVWRPEPSYVEDQVARIRRRLAESGLGAKRLFLTVWNITASNRSVVNDSVNKGTYLLDVANRSLRSGVDMLVYWMASDLYAESTDSSALLFGGSGLVTPDGLVKPALHAFVFLKKLRSRLIDRGPGYIISANQSGIYTIVYYRHWGVSPVAMLKDEGDITLEDLSVGADHTARTRLQIRIRNVQNGVYNVRRQYVNSLSGSALDVWSRLGALDIQSGEDKQYIAARAIPDRIFERIRVRDGLMELEITAGENEFGVVEIEFQPGVGDPPVR